MNKKIAIITTTIVLLSVIIVALFFILAFDIDVKKMFESPTKVAEEIEALSVETEAMTTNLSSNHYAVIKLNLLANNEHAKTEIEMRMPEIRAIIILTLASLTKDDLRGSEGLELLTSTLEKEMNAILEAGMVERVLLTEFKLK